MPFIVLNVSEYHRFSLSLLPLALFPDSKCFFAAIAVESVIVASQLLPRYVYGYLLKLLHLRLLPLSDALVFAEYLVLAVYLTSQPIEVVLYKLLVDKLYCVYPPLKMASCLPVSHAPECSMETALSYLLEANVCTPGSHLSCQCPFIKFENQLITSAQLLLCSRYQLYMLSIFLEGL